MVSVIEPGIVEGSDLVIAASVHDSHRLQTHALHGDLRRQQEAMVEIVEELVPGRDVVSFARNSHFFGRDVF